MLARTAAAAVIVTLALCTQARAIKLTIHVAPPLAGDAFGFKMTPLANDITRFTIRRNPAKAMQPTDPALKLVRGATLSVYGKDGLVTRCAVSPRRDKDGFLAYQFEIANASAKRSRFVLCETDDYKVGTGYIGGGAIYEFALIDFIDPQHKQKELKKRLRKHEQEMIEKLKIRVLAPGAANKP